MARFDFCARFPTPAISAPASPATRFVLTTAWHEYLSTGPGTIHRCSTRTTRQRSGLALERKKPLKRTSFKSKTRKPLNARSEKTKLRDDVRSELSAAWLEEAAATSITGVAECEIRWDRKCQGVATHAHEPKLRSRGGDILDRSECLLTCWHCHHSVHIAVGADLERAYADGFLKHSYEP